MRGLEDVANELSRCGILGDLWVDGSFLTEKIDPQDADVVLRLASDFVASSSVSQRDKLDWFAGNLKASYLCDSYVFVEFPPSDPRFAVGTSMHAYWMRQFGFSRGEQAKGIAVITLPVS